MLNERSIIKLHGIHPDLVAVINEASKTGSFIVTEGLRTIERQRELFRAGATKTLNSRHLTGHAVDLAVLVTGEIRWDWPLYKALSITVKDAASRLSIPIEWGGDWRSFKDGPHYQLPFKVYPNVSA